MCDFHSVNVCRMNGVCWSQACRRGKVSAGAGEGRCGGREEHSPGVGAGSQLVPGREGSVQPPDEFDLYSEGYGKL